MVKSTRLLPPTRRAVLVLTFACAIAFGLSLSVVSRQAAVTTARLRSAELALEALTERPPEADGRAAIAWGYAERMRLGLQSPFLLIEAASRDPRLTLDEQRTVSWALLASVLRGESHQVDPAALDRVSRLPGATGESHLELIESSIRGAEDPRVAELALRLAYVLCAAERVIDASGPTIVAQAAALVADREIARREAAQLLRSSNPVKPIAAIADARRRRALYVERPVLMTPSRSMEQEAIELVPAILAAVRSLGPAASALEQQGDSTPAQRAALLAVARRSPPSAEVSMTVKRSLPTLRQDLPSEWIEQAGRARNPEMLAAILGGQWSRDQRRQLGRLQLAAAVAMRTYAQAPAWPGGDVALSAENLGVASVSFDRDVPSAWRSQLLAALAIGVRDLKYVFPELTLDAINVRFRMTSPADSALAMHEPRSRTLHLPVSTAAGTLAHELAHDLDRQMSIRQGRAGYWSDAVTRSGDQVRGSTSRVAASMRTLTRDVASGRAGRGTSDRPAEIFATRVDWFVAQSLARQGISNGFLSAAQDEMLTGHVLHLGRLRGADRSRSLLTALEGMTAIAPAARAESEPTAYALMQYVLGTPIERRFGRVASAGEVNELGDAAMCDASPRGVVGLLRLAAESKARGVIRGRAESIPPDRRPIWAQEALGVGPWSGAAAAARVESLASELLGQLTIPGLLQAGIGSRASALLRSAGCED